MSQVVAGVGGVKEIRFPQRGLPWSLAEHQRCPRDDERVRCTCMLASCVEMGNE